MSDIARFTSEKNSFFNGIDAKSEIASSSLSRCFNGPISISIVSIIVSFFSIHEVADISTSSSAPFSCRTLISMGGTEGRPFRSWRVLSRMQS